MTKVTRFTMNGGGGQGTGRLHLREISGDADAPLGTVGQDLRAARLRRGDDLARVARDLKIRKDHLEALEEDRVEALPGRTYAVGFVRTYAIYLGLDADECVERFKAEIAGRAESPHLTPFVEQTERRLPQGWVIVAAILAALLVYGVYRIFAGGDVSNEAPVAPVPTQLVPKPALPPPLAPKQAAAPRAAAPLTAGGERAAVPSPSEAAGESATPAEAPPLPKGVVFGLRNPNPRVIVRAHKATLVDIRGADGTIYLNRVLQPGDSYRVPNMTGLTLSAGDGGAVELLLDGTSQGYVASGMEPVKGVSLDPQAVADRKNAKTPG